MGGGKNKSGVWKHFKEVTQDGPRSNTNRKASCNLCDRVFTISGGSTSTLWQHLRLLHEINPSSQSNKNALPNGSLRDLMQPSTSKSSDAMRMPATSSASTSQRNAPSGNSDDVTGGASSQQPLSTAENGDTVQTGPSTTEKKRKLKVESKQQTTMHSFAHRKLKEHEILSIIKSIALFIATDLLPISVVEGMGFISLMRHILGEDFPMPSRDTIMKNLRQIYAESKTVVQESIDSVEWVNLTTDCWTSKAGDSYITGTAHSIDKNWHIKSDTLFTCGMAERHYSKNLKHKLTSKAIEFNIQQKILSTTHDNAANITKAVKESEILGESNPCAAHTLNLCVMAALLIPGIWKLIKKCKKVVGHFKHSTVASEQLLEIQIERNFPKHSLIQCCKTRWNSFYDMLIRLKEQRFAIHRIISDTTMTKETVSKKLDISNDEWTLIDSIINILKPFSITLTYLCGDKYVTLSEVRPSIYALLKHVKPATGVSSVISDFKCNLYNSLSTRFKICLEGVNVTIPSQNRTEPKKKSKQNSVCKKISEMVNESSDSSADESDSSSDATDPDSDTETGQSKSKTNSKNTAETQNSDTETSQSKSKTNSKNTAETQNSDTETSQSKSKTNSKNTAETQNNSNLIEVTFSQIASFLHPKHKNLLFEPINLRALIKSTVERLYSAEKGDEDDDNSSDLATDYDQFLNQSFEIDTQNSNEFESYVNERVFMNPSGNPLIWWKDNEHKYPTMARLARKYLAVPATSASSERVFSTAGNIITNKRTCLLPVNVDMLVFLYQNSTLRQQKRNKKQKI